MPATIRQVLPDSKISQHVSWSLIEGVIPPETVEQVQSSCHAWEQREKKLTMRAIVYWLIALQVFSTCSMRKVWRRLVEGYCALGLSQPGEIPTAGALCQRRAQLGVTVIRELFARCVHPIATAATKGHFTSICGSWPWMGRWTTCPIRTPTAPSFLTMAARATDTVPFPNCAASC